MGIVRFLSCALFLAFAPAAHAQQVPQSPAQITLSFAPVVKQVAPAVVNIYTKGKVQVRDRSISPLMNDPFFQQFFGNNFAFNGRTREQTVSSLGSGVIVKADGMIVTSRHVIKDAQTITVVLSDNREFEATVVSQDSQSDLAFLKVNAATPLPYLAMRDSDTLEVGDLVLAIGNPFGVGQTVTHGIISGLARKAAGVSDYQFFIQTDAAINPGNSGGALVDMQGRLIGINTAIYSRSGGSNGIGFAIPANMVRTLMEGNVVQGRVVRPWVGASVQPVTREVANSLGLDVPKGVLVRAVMPGSPAEKGGLQVGDVILSINNATISSEQELRYRVVLERIGSEVDFAVLRKGAPVTLRIAMQPPVEIPARNLRALKGQHPLDGVSVANLSPALAIELGMEDGSSEGVVVMGLAKGSVAGSLGVQPGDILRSVNGVPVTSTEQLQHLLKQAAREWKFVVERGGRTLSLNVRL